MFNQNGAKIIKLEGAYPRVTMRVQIPIFWPLSFAKNVSVTTALLMAIAGEMKNDTSTLVTI